MKLAAIFVLLTHLSFGQTQQAINNDVWKPFIKSFNEFDTDAFLAVHSHDLVRSARDAKTILNWQNYYNEQKANNAKSKASGIRRTIELRFTERIASQDQAIDVGIYKTTAINSKGESSSFYGRFHVALRKENGIWKILVDTDSSEGGTVTETDFIKAQPLE
jgi:hypothetical protein